MFEIKLFTIDHFVLWIVRCLLADVTFNHECFFSNLSCYFEHFTSVTGEENSLSASWSKICPHQHNNNKTRRLQVLHQKTKHPIRMYWTAANSRWLTTRVWSRGYPWRHRYTLSVFSLLLQNAHNFPTTSLTINFFVKYA